MRSVEHHRLINRFRDAARDLDAHMRMFDLLSDAFGFSYLNAHLADDIAAELKLRDVFDDLQADLAVELLEEDVIPYDDGYYKIDANGQPRFFRGATVGAGV